MQGNHRRLMGMKKILLYASRLCLCSALILSPFYLHYILHISISKICVYYIYVHVLTYCSKYHRDYLQFGVRGL